MLRAILSRSSESNDGLSTLVDQLVRTHRAEYASPDVPLLRKAYRIGEQMHRGQMRKSGEPYITHPLAVTQILADLGMDTTTLAASLLHDTVEDTSYTLEQLRADFGTEVAWMVDGVTKLDKVSFGEVAEAETTRKLIVAAGRDIRVMVIKLADRVHNMQTLGFKSRPSQVRIAKATQDVLIPLADRLGLYVLKRELEDLVLGIIEPELYQEIEAFLSCGGDRNTRVEAARRRLAPQLREVRVAAEIVDRPRHHYSVYRERNAGRPSGGHDPLRLVLLVEGSDTDCYAALGAVHNTWQPIPGRFKDFIASPKFNMYQSLHTTVFGPDHEPMDVMVRTRHMNRVAELGIIAQLSPSGQRAHRGPEKLLWLTRLLDWQRETNDSAKFLESLRCDLADEQILVFTSQGKQVLMPLAATPVDLAYSVDTRIGDRLIGAYVNGRLVPLSRGLADGDLVEIITAEGGDYPGPSQEWLLTAKTPQAQLQISQWFAGHRDDRLPEKALGERITAGRAALKLALHQRDRGLSTDEPLMRLGRDLGYRDVDALCLAVSDGKIDAEQLADRLIDMVDRVPLSSGAPKAWRAGAPDA